MKYLICIFILLIPVYIFTIPKSEPETKPETKEIIVNNVKEEDSEKVVKLLNGVNVIKLSLEDYILGVIACEMPASFEIEALKAQAVASRTFALEKMKEENEYDLENSANDQCYSSIEDMQKKWGKDYNKYYTKIKEAVYSTKNEYITYNNKIIKAFYFSTSNGYTENVQNVFGEKLEYLVPVSSSWDTKTSSYEKETTFTEKNFLNLLKLKDEKIISINIDEKNETGRVSYISINSQKFKGTTFRKLLGIRSTDFDISFKNDIVYIKTRGYGHGVGLSQYGSNGMAKEGYKYEEIIKYYYKNTEIKNV